MQPDHYEKKDAKPSIPRFEIKPRGSTDVYVYAWHGEEGDCAAHRNPDQWQFFVVAEQDLPNQQSIGLNPLKRIACPCTIAALKDRVMEALVRWWFSGILYSYSDMVLSL